MNLRVEEGVDTNTQTIAIPVSPISLRIKVLWLNGKSKWKEVLSSGSHKLNQNLLAVKIREIHLTSLIGIMKVITSTLVKANLAKN